MSGLVRDQRHHRGWRILLSLSITLWFSSNQSQMWRQQLCVSERWCGVKEVAAEGGWVGRSTHPQLPITVFWDGTAPCSVQRLFHGFSSLCADVNTVKKDKQTQKNNRLCDVLASNKSKHLIMCTLRTKLLHDECVACSLQPAACSLQQRIRWDRTGHTVNQTLAGLCV